MLAPVNDRSPVPLGQPKNRSNNDVHSKLCMVFRDLLSESLALARPFDSLDSSARAVNFATRPPHRRALANTFSTPPLSKNMVATLDALRRQYEEFVLANAPQVTAVESMARNLAFFLPGRVIQSELAAECVFAGLNLLGIYHDAILAPHFPAASPPSSQPALFNKYTRAAMSRPGYKALSYTLATLSGTEVVLELLARRRGDRARWDAVLAIEGVKAALRLFMLNATNGRMVLSPSVPTRDYDANQPFQQAGSSLAAPSLNDIFGNGDGPKDPAAVGKFLTNKALTDPSNLRPGDLVGTLDTYRKWAEIAFILRPVIYGGLEEDERASRISGTHTLVPPGSQST